MSLMLVFSMSVVAFEGVTPFNPWTAPSDQHYSSYHQLISQVSPCHAVCYSIHLLTHGLLKSLSHG